MYSIGVDLGGTFTKLALVSPDGQILGSRRIPARPGLAVEETFREIRRRTEEMALECGEGFPPQGGCGIGVPAVVDHRTGHLVFSGSLGWQDQPVGSIAAEILGCDTAVDTDVNAGALADLYFGCAQDSSDMLYVSWGTGIGAGLVIDRRLYHSLGGAMCNLGHMPADPSSDRLCYCGTRGCLEIEAGGKAMVEQIAARLQQGEVSILSTVAELTPQSVALAAEAGDPLAREVLERAAALMARVLAGVMALLNPDTIVFGGGVSQCLPLVQHAFDEELRMRAPAFSLPLTQIKPSQFGDNAGMLGAAMLPATRRSI